jgi:hypothetical protein
VEIHHPGKDRIMTTTTAFHAGSLTATLASLVLVGSGLLVSPASAAHTTEGNAAASAPGPDIDDRVAQEKTAMAAYRVRHGLFGAPALAAARVGARTT